MKNKSAIFSLLLAGLLLPLLFSCKKEVLPTVTVAAVTNITDNSATSGGEIISDGGAGVTARGVCWSTSQNPTTADSKTTNGTGTGSFTSSITGLTPGATYNLKAYAINAVGTAYSSQISFSTLALAPVLITTDVSTVTSSSVNSGGNITNESGSPVTARGVCWSTTQNPTVADNKTTDGSGSGIFISAITGLTPGTTYYIRAYATNSIGTAYGNQVTTTTTATIPTISTTAVSVITATSAISGGTISSDGGATVTERGVYWGTTDNPETTGTKLKADATTNVFSVTIPDINPSTTYYVKAYAINSKGTAYGNLVSFKTSEFKLAVVDISEESEWDYWVTAKNGDSYFLKETSNKPTAILLKFSSSTVRTPIFFNQQGFPEKVIINDVVYVFDNYNGKFLDIAAILPNGVIDVVKNVETEINWDLYKQKGPALYASIILNYVGRGIGAVPCALKIGAAKASFGLLWAQAAWSCANYGVSLTADISEEEFGVSNGFTEFVKSYSVADLVNSCLSAGNDPLDCLFSLAADSYDYLSDELKILDAKNQQIEDAKYIISSGFKVNTNPVTDCTFNSAKVGGNVTNDGVNAIYERGVYYSTGANPEISGTKFQIGTGIGDFSSTLTGLLPNTTYLLKAFARSSQKVEYGSQVTFKTTTNQLPALTTTAVTNISNTSATSGGNITSDGGATITARGICWSTSSNPTTSNSRTTNSTGTGSFTSSITGLSANTTYYVRAYATNSVGTAYGSQVSFSTDQTTDIPSVTTASISSITQNTATGGGNVTSDGNLTVTARGVCWSTSANPTTALSTKTTDGTGTGSFISSITSLTSNTTYYVRAYATNSQGTAYGTQVSFTTSSVSQVVPTLTTTAASSITSTTATSGGNVTSEGSASVTARGVCWSTSANPTTALSTKTTNGTGTGSFTSSITGLSSNTTYYVRAYATNSIGTAYGNQINFLTSSVGTLTGTFTDSRDGITYSWVQIGTQTWMAENLAYLPSVTTSSAFSYTTPYYFVYGYDGTNIASAKATSNYSTYGVLYNWEATKTACPTGWHLPTDEEWKILEMNQGMSNSDADLSGSRESGSVGWKLKETGTTHWFSPNSGATNISGFTALPGGWNNVGFSRLGNEADFWSASEWDAVNGWIRLTYLNYNGMFRAGVGKSNGLSVRCLKD